eukprot:768320-Hanusia_phi.AAC.3
MRTSLLQHYRESPPDINDFRKTREASKDIAGENSVKQLLVPPPMSSSIMNDSKSNNRLHRQVSMIEDEIGTSRQGKISLVSPLLWVPGVLRSKGPWATVMRETDDGESYMLTAGLEWDHATVDRKEEDDAKQKLVQAIKAKDRIIAELDETIKASKRSLEAIEVRTKTRHQKLRNELKLARAQDRERHLKETQSLIAPLKQQTEFWKERYSTLKQAHYARIKNGFAQDTFSSKYNSAMMKVKDIARDLSRQEVESLRNRVSALERKAKTDAHYILDLKQRLVVAAKTAESRYSEAESKIPVLENELLEARQRMSRVVKTYELKLYRERKRIEQLEADRTKKPNPS